MVLRAPTASALLAVVLLLCALDAVGAQELGSLEGVVRDVTTGLPVAGVRVTLLGPERSAVTDREGRYRLDGLQTGPVNIRVEGEAYAVITDRLRIYDDTPTRRDFYLAGTGDALAVLIRARASSASVQELDEDDLRQGTERTATDALDRSVSGLVLRPDNQGQGSARTLLRGVVSITGSNEPLVYVDGVRMTSADGRAATILDQIDLTNVDRIEVLKGSAASVEYGPAAAGGVILVHTKRGGGA